MAVDVIGPGRPCFVADIPFQNDRKVALINEFYNACETFHNREIMGISRALGIWPSTIKYWKYKKTFPRWDVAIDIIEWVRLGKPGRFVPPSRSSPPMM